MWVDLEEQVQKTTPMSFQMLGRHKLTHFLLVSTLNSVAPRMPATLKSLDGPRQLGFSARGRGGDMDELKKKPGMKLGETGLILTVAQLRGATGGFLQIVGFNLGCLGSQVLTTMSRDPWRAHLRVGRCLMTFPFGMI